MKFSLAPKQFALLVWGLFALLTLIAVAVYQLARPLMPALPRQDAPIAAAGDIARIQQAEIELAGLSQREHQWGPLDVTPGPVVAPSPKVQVTVAGPDSSGFSSLIVFQGPRGTVAMLGGQVLRVGQRLQSGDLVERIGKTFVILKPASGESRRIDMNNRFLPRQSQQTPEPSP